MQLLKYCFSFCVTYKGEYLVKDITKLKPTN